MTENVRKTTLSNGVRVVTETIEHVASVAIGLWVAAGSRDETDRQRGLAHFLEHMLFKGTTRRPGPQQIADEMDNVGGFLNAFTDKEYTCYHVRVLSEHLPLAIDLLCDMYTDSLFDPEETARERKVVLEEIKRRDDDPEDLVHDAFAQALFGDHPLGLPVIGEARLVAGFSPDDLRGYLAAHGGAQNLIVSAVGQLDHGQVVALVEKALGGRGGGQARAALPPLVPKPGVATLPRPDEQVNFCIGSAACSHFDEDRYPLALLDAVLGGSMGARLFMEIREKRGLAYTVGSYTTGFREGGYFAAYGGTSPDSFEECRDLVFVELVRVRTDGVTGEEMARAKMQFRSALVMAQESMNSRMMRLGKAEAIYGEILPLETVLARIESVTPDDVLRVAQRVLPEAPDGLTVCAVGPLGESEEV